MNHRKVCLLLIESGACSPTPVRRDDCAASKVGRGAELSESATSPVELVRTDLERKAGRRVRRCRLKNVDRAVHSARAVDDSRRSAQDFNGSGLLEIDLEHLVHVTKADRPNRHAVLEEEK